jgi:hypothetical protein
MIEALPAMLGYDINNNIRPKLRYIHQLLRCFHVPFDKDRLSKDFLAFFGCKKEKIQLCARILSRSHVPSPVSFSQLSKILRINIEQLILASSELSAGHSLANLLQKSEEIKTRNLSSDQKTARILAECDRKIVQIYQRGYREKRK